MGKVAVVTGGNRGIGFALVETLCRSLGRDATVYLCARDLERGAAAVALLEGRGLSPVLAQLDIASDDSVGRFADQMRGRHGGYDILVGNAGAIPLPDQHAQIDDFINTNNGGTDRLIHHSRTLLRDGGRFLTVASRHGIITSEAFAVSEEPGRDDQKNRLFGATSYFMSPENRRRFYPEETTIPEIQQALRDFTDAFKAGRAKADGWPDWINIPSKAGQVASTLVFAHEMKEEARRRDILINACCPGFVETDATRRVYTDFSLAATPLQAAADLAWAVLIPPGTREPYGRMLRRREVLQVHD
jgi:carbonyl reductase 1